MKVVELFRFRHAGNLMDCRRLRRDSVANDLPTGVQVMGS